MNGKSKQRLATTLGLVILIFIGYVLYELATLFINLIKSLDPALASGLITASSTVIVSVVAITLGKYFERKKEVDTHFREMKVEIYNEFLVEFFSMMSDESEKNTEGDQTETIDTELVSFLQDWQRKIILWGGPNVVSTYIKWMLYIKKGNADAKSLFLTEEFFKALRKDIGLSNLGLKKGELIHLILRNSELFLTLANENPDVTLMELSLMENQMKNN